MKFKIKLLLFCLFSCILLQAQTISGIIYDSASGKTLPGASIYLDGTTIGVTSDFNGAFQLDLKKSENATVVVSFVGYDTKTFSTNNFVKPKNIYLKESSNQLNEVELGLDIWSREKKMRIFKTEFLGRAESSTQCKILNKKDITLIYNSALNTLTAYADKPIIIRNKYLGYEVKYNIVDFEIKFIHTPSGMRITNELYYAGTSFFTELKDKTKKKVVKNRDDEYFGSLVHFMKSIATKQLTENTFDIYYKSFPTHPYKYFNITSEGNLTKVEMTAEKLSVLYNGFDQSSLEPLNKESNFFYIDASGNHSPPNSLIFGGAFGHKRISSLLPLDYVPQLE